MIKLGTLVYDSSRIPEGETHETGIIIKEKFKNGCLEYQIYWLDSGTFGTYWSVADMDAYGIKVIE